MDYFMKIIKNRSGNTLVEVMIVTAILAFVLTTMLQLFIQVSMNAEMSGNKTIALSAAQDKIEEIRREDYDDISVNYASGGTPGDTFSFQIDDRDAMGKVYIISTENPTSPSELTGETYPGANAESLAIKVVVSWENALGRVVGEDLDLDGSFEAGEDANSNGLYDSPITLISYITRR